MAEDDARDPETGRVPRERRWRLRDNYARFFLKYVEPVAEAIDSGSFEIARLESLEGIESVMCLAFENLVANHVRDLLQHLNLKGPWSSPQHPGGAEGRKTAAGEGGARSTCSCRRAELSAKAYSGSMTGMSMLRLREEKLMPTRVTGRLPPFHLSA